MTEPSTRIGGMHHESRVTLLFTAILMVIGSVSAAVLGSWVFTSLFVVSMVVWVLRLVAQIRANL